MADKLKQAITHGALDVLVGYCAPEIYQMATGHGPMCIVALAAHEILDAIGLSWPQFLAENAERLGLETDRG